MTFDRRHLPSDYSEQEYVEFPILDALDRGEMGPLIVHLRAGRTLSAVLAEEVALAIEGLDRTGTEAQAPIRRPTRSARRDADKIGAWCMVRIDRSQRGARDRIFKAACGAFPDLTEPRTARRYFESYQRKCRKARQEYANDPFKFAEIKGLEWSALEALCAELGVDFFTEMVSSIIPDQTPKG